MNSKGCFQFSQVRLSHLRRKRKWNLRRFLPTTRCFSAAWRFRYGGKPLPATVLPASFQLPEHAVRLEAETPSEYEGEELYLIGRPFVSGGKFGFRFHQSDQLLRWRFKLERPGRYRILIRSAGVEPAVREIARNDELPVAVALEATGGDGRKENHWRWMELPGGMEFKAGEQTLEMRFNRGISALDVLVLVPEKE